MGPPHFLHLRAPNSVSTSPPADRPDPHRRPRPPPAPLTREDVAEYSATLDNISERIAKLSATMTAMQTEEAHFSSDIQHALDCVDDFLLHHADQDARLAARVTEDTRRTQAAQKEYETLLLQFGPNVQRPSSKLPEFLSGAALYLRIVLSVVFMAPLYAIWTLFAKLWQRLSFLRSGHQPKTPVPNGIRDETNPIAHQATSQASSLVPTYPHDKADPSTSVHAQNKQSAQALANPNSSAVDDLSPTTPETDHPRRSVDPDSSDDDNDFLDAVDNALEFGDNLKARKDDPSEDNFRTAPNTESGSPTHTQTSLPPLDEQVDKIENLNTSPHDNDKPSRPGWAILEDDAAFPQSPFPSNDFWDMSVDEMSRDRLRAEPKPAEASRS